ncbi:hypothetical protein PROFUN_16885, partial [Planoprotostelium fungivorum]
DKPHNNSFGASESKIFAGIEAEVNKTSKNDPINMWLQDWPVFCHVDGKPQAVDPINYWLAKLNSATDHHHCLAQMALDVLSCPATSTDIERCQAFATISQCLCFPPSLLLARGLAKVSRRSKTKLVCLVFVSSCKFLRDKTRQDGSPPCLANVSALRQRLCRHSLQDKTVSAGPYK